MNLEKLETTISAGWPGRARLQDGEAVPCALLVGQKASLNEMLWTFDVQV